MLLLATKNLLLWVEMLFCWQNPLLMDDLRELLAERSAAELFWRLTSVGGGTNKGGKEGEQKKGGQVMPTPKLLWLRNMSSTSHGEESPNF